MPKTIIEKDVLVLVATDFEDVELITVIDILARHDISFDLVSIENKVRVRGKYQALVNAKIWNSIAGVNYRALFLPGGPGTEHLLASKPVKDLVQQFAASGKIISAICAAPSVLAQANVLGEHRFTAYPGVAPSKNNTAAPVERDGNLLTGRDFRAAPAFADELVKMLTS